MSYLATLCDQCHHVSLVPLAKFAGRRPLCEACNEALRVFPSCSYSAQDLSLFRELSDMAAEGAVSASEAGLLAQDISHALWSGAHDACWDKLSARLLGLLPLQLVIGGNHATRARALKIFRTIFEALATTRRSGYVSTTAPARASRERQA